MILTLQMIRDASTQAGGWTRAQLAIIGLQWPQSHGWASKVVGMNITPEQYQRFFDAKNQRAKPKRNKKLPASQRRKPKEIQVKLLADPIFIGLLTKPRRAFIGEIKRRFYGYENLQQVIANALVIYDYKRPFGVDLPAVSHQEQNSQQIPTRCVSQDEIGLAY